MKRGGQHGTIDVGRGLSRVKDGRQHLRPNEPRSCPWFILEHLLGATANVGIGGEHQGPSAAAKSTSDPGGVAEPAVILQEIVAGLNLDREARGPPELGPASGGDDPIGVQDATWRRWIGQLVGRDLEARALEGEARVEVAGELEAQRGVVLEQMEESLMQRSRHDAHAIGPRESPLQAVCRFFQNPQALMRLGP